MKIVKNHSTENCHFTAVKNRCILHGFVFVMSLQTEVENQPSSVERHTHHWCHVEDNLLYCLAVVWYQRLQNKQHMSLVLRKPVFGVSDQVRYKPGCAVTEDG